AVTPLRGQREPLTKALGTEAGLALPEPGGTSSAGDLSIRWAGLDETWLLGAPEAQVRAWCEGLGAVTDLTDGWARVRLTGPDADAVLARLTPVDPAAIAPGVAVRTDLAHMMAHITGLVAGYEIAVMRSFATTLVHDIEAAMRSVIAQSSLE
ncbi:MAG: sarcosine oxidase subunit gamma, partial [Pseudomonadota bacterium]